MACLIPLKPTLMLPAFGGEGMYGNRVHEAVLDAGVRVTGATVHFVDEEYDRGPIIAQWPVPVLPGDTADVLAARVLAVEHRLYPAALDAVAGGRVTLGTDGRVAGWTIPAAGLTAFTLSNVPADAELGPVGPAHVDADTSDIT